ncbi:MAG: tetratricopeptide repeat protein, partial [Candidatus Saccharimonadales bacterium]
MKHLIIILGFLVAGTGAFAQAKKYIHKGNQLYKEQKYKEAEADYRKSADSNANSRSGQNAAANFNLGDALYKQKKFTDAGDEFNKLGESSAKNKLLAAAAYHNLGNSLLENKKLEESIKAYEKALLNNPKDDQTRYNLAYAQDKLKKQQQQKKQNQNNKNQNNKDQQNKDSQNKNGKNKDNKDQGKQNKDNKDQQNKDQQHQDKLSKQDAERMLDALNNNEKQTLD